MVIAILFYSVIAAVLAIVILPLLRPALRYACGQAARWGLGIGGVLFLLGFIGPIVFSPGSNQGPLLGIFVTGPFGFLLGAFGGFFNGVHRPQMSDRGSAKAHSARHSGPSAPPIP